MNPLGELSALRAQALELDQVGFGAETRRILIERAELEARSAGFPSPEAYRSAAFDLMRRQSESSRLIDEMFEKRSGVGSALALDGESSISLAMQAAEAHRRWEEAFKLPAEAEAIRLFREHAEAMDAYSRQIGNGLAEHLLGTARAMTAPWLNEELGTGSALAMMKMQAIGQAMRQHGPFDSATAEVLRSALGDWRGVAMPGAEVLVDPVGRSGLYHERGFSPHLTAFPRPAFVEGMHHAGLDLDGVGEDFEPSDSSSDGDPDQEASFARNRSAFDQLQRFEVEIRRFIDKKMTAAYGARWIDTQLPPETRDEWRRKQAVEAKVSGEEKSLIEFADFTDYRLIIERRSNWSTVFSPVFGRQADIQESLLRLYPVRIATMHSRIITQDDEMLLTVETRRILKAVRRR